MTNWKSDSEPFDLIKTRRYTPVMGDVLDCFTDQFLPQPVQPLLPEMKLAGRAMPVLMIDVHGPQKKPFGKLTEALDQLQPGEIYLASGGDRGCAYRGEILTATARMRGVVGAVVNDFHRDTPRDASCRALGGLFLLVAQQSPGRPTHRRLGQALIVRGILSAQGGSRMHMSSAANLFTMVSDMFPKQVVGSVVALGVIFGSLSAMAFAQLTGFIWQTMGNYWPLFLIASSAYLVALAIIHALIPHMTPMEFEAVAKSVPTQSNNQNKL